MPVSALMVFCPMIATFIILYREDKTEGIKKLMSRILDYNRIKKKIWYVPTILTMSIILILSYFIMRWLGKPLPKTHISFLSIPILFIVYFASAVGEDIGWMGYLADPMIKRWNALKTGIILGVIWAVWHIIPYIQGNHNAMWIVGQCFFTVAARVLIIWIYKNTGRSLFAALLFHTMINVSDTLFPNEGSHYDPVITAVITIALASIIVYLWGAKTLSKYRYVREKN